MAASKWTDLWQRRGVQLNAPTAGSRPRHIAARIASPALIVLALLAAGCGALGGAPGLVRSMGTATPVARCSPELCADNACSGAPGQCASACSAICATPTPYSDVTPSDIATSTANPSPTVTTALEAGRATPATPAASGAPCAIVVRTPPPDAPTASAYGTALPRQVDPHVEICASATRLRIGDTLTLRAQPVDIGLPDYVVSARDNGSADPHQIVQVSYDNHVTGTTAASQVLEFVSAQASMAELVLTLRARSAGTTELAVGASGEVHYGYPGPATWSGGGSQPITITVTP
jgi:hypothetical protein